MTTTTVSPAAAAVQSARRCTAAPQDRRILRSKRALRDALIELMEERSFDGFSVNDLCERADLNRGTFYNHFRDKDDLLAQLEAEVMEDLERFQVQMRNLTVHELLGYRARKKPLPLLVGLFDLSLIHIFPRCGGSRFHSAVAAERRVHLRNLGGALLPGPDTGSALRRRAAHRLEAHRGSRSAFRGGVRGLGRAVFRTVLAERGSVHVESHAFTSRGDRRWPAVHVHDARGRAAFLERRGEMCIRDRI